jgi:Domain of unknown function (DUF4397)
VNIKSNRSHICVLLCLPLLLGMFGIATQAQAATGGNQARVRVVHASPDTPVVDVYVNGVRAFKALAFKEITNYAGLAAGSYRLQVVPAGKSLVQGPMIISTTAKLEAGKDYSVVATGLREAIQPLLLVDNNTLPDPSKARVRFVHLSPDAPVVNVVSSAANNRKLFSKVGFEQAGEYVTMDAGRYNLAVQSAEDDTTLLSLKGVPVGNGQVVTVFGMGLSEGQPTLRAVVSVDAATTKLFPITGDEVAGVATVVEMASEADTPVLPWGLLAIGLELVVLAVLVSLWRVRSAR